MILSDTAILKAMDAGDIVIAPFNINAMGGNSYDVHLSQYVVTYQHAADLQEMMHFGARPVLDAKKPPITQESLINDEGVVLYPGILYLMSTIEYTETLKHVPYLDGKSSTGRLGVRIHETAGRGDVGFKGHWTMEITVVQPVRVYYGMPIGQLTFHTVEGEVERSYDKKTSAKYAVDSADPRPAPSRMYKNFAPKE